MTQRPKRYLAIVLCVAFHFFFILPCLSMAKENILIGAAISLSGPNAVGAGITQVPNYKMWVEEVNDRGGIFVKRYGKKLPIKLILYDDKSDIGTAVELVEKLILVDRVDLLLPPWSTTMHFAIAPVASKYGYPIIGPTISSEKMREFIHKIPYFFGILNMPREQAEALVELLVELMIKKVALIYGNNAYGIEWTAKTAPALGIKDIDVKILKSYPLGSKDLSPLLKTIKSADVDALLCMSYPNETFLISKQARDIDFSPDLLYLGVGVAFPLYRDDVVGVNAVEGIMGPGVWNPKLAYPGVKQYFDRHIQSQNKEPDRWASAFVYASLQVIEQAIGMVGSLDRKKLRDCIATRTFQTIVGPVKFEDSFNVHSPGEIGQWQSGEFQIVAGKEKRTAKPIFPKPPWK